MMNVNHIFVDTNVLIGACMGNKTDKKCLDYLYALQGRRLYTSTLAIAQFVSVFQGRMDDSVIRKKVKYFLTKFELVTFSEKDVEEALKETSNDIEDNIQFVMCRKVKCHFVITNNIKDYMDYNIIDVLPPCKCRKIDQ